MEQGSKLLKLWLPLFTYMAFMWLVSSISGIKLPTIKILGFDKLLHVIEYGIFGYLVARALSPDKRPRKRIVFVLTVIACGLGWGIIDEIHQFFVPMRLPSVYDVVADCLGAWGGGMWYLKLRN